MLNEMERFLIEHTEEDYYNHKVNFTFGDSVYRTSVNFAYFNTNLDMILKKYGVKFDESWMMTKAFTAKNYKKFMDSVVEKLFDLYVDISTAQSIILEIVTLTNKMINFFSAGKRITLDFNLVNISLEVLKNKKLKDVMTDSEITDEMTPEEIMSVRKRKISELQDIYTPGVTELLKSGHGVKPDQLVNIFGGIHLIPRIHNMNEMFPRRVPIKWLDGINNKEQFFMVGNINAYALYMSKTVIQRSGEINKMATMIAQDCLITEKDCGSINPVEYLVTKDNLKTFRRKYFINDNNELEEFTLNHTHLIGKRVKFRSVFTCATKNGCCETCVGTMARWNKSTKEYRKDLGVEFSKMDITAIFQGLMSTKHNTAPLLVNLELNYYNIKTPKKDKQLDAKDNKFFTRAFNQFVFKPYVKVFLDKADCTNELFESRKQKKERIEKGIKLTEEDFKNKPLEYVDNEFGEKDIIRSTAIIVELDGEQYKIHGNSHFRISGLSADVFSLYEGEPIVELIPGINNITHVMLNNFVAKRFYDLEKLYKTSTPDDMRKYSLDDEESDEDFKEYIDRKNYVFSYQEFIEKVVQALPTTDKVELEVVFRNKIRDAYDKHKRPDWTKPNPEAVVLTGDSTVTVRPSLSLKIAAGHIKKRVNNAFYHDIRNLESTSYDRIYWDEERVKAIERGER